MKEKTAVEKKRLSKKAKIIMGITIPVGFILLVVLALYIGGSIFYGRMHYDPADTTLNDDETLAEILNEDINAACEGFSQEAIDRVRSAIVLVRLDHLPFDVNYREILDTRVDD